MITYLGFAQGSLVPTGKEGRRGLIVLTKKESNVIEGARDVAVAARGIARGTTPRKLRLIG
jgi:hypothetical protein